MYIIFINHLEENINIFDFSLKSSEMQELDDLNNDFRVVEDPVLYRE